ncbi:hypothetical protein Q5794_30160 (plasmid) [Priestia megaterium]|uniref:hypothetical protein n=1 Tax=Priestia megaterium TaxID=1404 RepID=UPI0035BE856F
MKELYDPKFKVPLDVPHLAASLNSTIFIWGTNGFIADLAGWAGDLLTTAEDSVNAGEQYSSTYEAALDFIGNKEKGQFGLADLIADVDALNIGYILGNSTKQLNTAMKEYYSQGYKKRFTSFLNNRFSIPNMEKSKYVATAARLPVYLKNKKEPLLQ